jgi:glutamate-1-semialdehyde 2,1-aminomutase
MKAVEKRLSTGTMFGMPHDMEWEFAEEICARYPVEMARFGNSGTEATMHAIRLARAATGRDHIIKFEGGYHRLHDAALVSVKPHDDEVGDFKAPNSAPGGLGLSG